MPPQGAIIDKGDIIQYPGKYVEILRPEDSRSSKNRKPISEVNAGPAVTGTITRGQSNLNNRKPRLSRALKADAKHSAS